MTATAIFDGDENHQWSSSMSLNERTVGITLFSRRHSTKVSYCLELGVIRGEEERERQRWGGGAGSHVE